MIGGPGVFGSDSRVKIFRLSFWNCLGHGDGSLFMSTEISNLEVRTHDQMPPTGQGCARVSLMQTFPVCMTDSSKGHT